MADKAERRAPDGSDPHDYRWLASLDREGWAWEWLRRDPDYRGARRPETQASAEPLFLTAGSPDPHRGLLFRRGSHPLRPGRCHFLRRSNERMVLPCDVVDSTVDRVDLLRTDCFSALLRGDDPCEHVLLSDGIRRVRLDVHGGSLREGPVALRFRFTGLARIGAPLTTLQVFLPVALTITQSPGTNGSERLPERSISRLEGLKLGAFPIATSIKTRRQNNSTNHSTTSVQTGRKLTRSVQLKDA